ncbi:MAG: MarR family transcriptional regulator, partial [Dehalococcoidia bacterium]
MYDLRFSDTGLTTWALLRQTWSVMCKVAETRLAKVHLTPEKISVLWACKEHHGPLIPAEIARIVSRESQSVTGLLNRMESEGLITRIPKRKGRPFTEVRLTDKGEEACIIGVAVLKRVITEVMSPLQTDELEHIHEPLRALRQQAAKALHLEVSLPPNLAPEEAIPISL